jgi:hypothetical protein
MDAGEATGLQVLNSGSQHGSQVADSKNGITPSGSPAKLFIFKRRDSIPRKYSGMITALLG